MLNVPPPAETIHELRSAVYPSFAMLAGMQLGLFTPLAEGPHSAEQLAAALSVDLARLRPLLYALVTAGLLTVEEHRFANTLEANYYLVRGSPYYIGSAHELISDLWGALLKTAESIRTGKPQAKHDFLAMTDEELGAFFRGLHSGALAAGRELVQRYDFSGYHTLLDVGGGSGGVSIAIVQAHPHLQVTVVDLPKVTPFTQRFIEEAGAEKQVAVMAADAVQDALSGVYDVAVLRAFTQVLPPDGVRTALKNVGQVVRPGGEIYLVASTLDDSCLAPLETVGFNLVFLNVYEGGQAYTESEYKTWLAEAGFDWGERVQLPGSASILRARRHA